MVGWTSKAASLEFTFDKRCQLGVQVKKLGKLGLELQPHGGQLLQLNIQVFGHVLKLRDQLAKL
jgi:hypothetical protein